MMPGTERTNMTAADQKTVFYRYDSANKLTSVTRLKFTAREEDGTGLYYYRARYYQPSVGRFVSEDPIEHLSGEFDFYIYSQNNPFSFTDPLGLKAQCCNQDWLDCMNKCLKANGVNPWAAAALPFGPWPKPWVLPGSSPYSSAARALFGLKNLGRSWFVRYVTIPGVIIYGNYAAGVEITCSIQCLNDSCAW
jgi:RHS repeat-associated protein